MRTALLLSLFLLAAIGLAGCSHNRTYTTGAKASGEKALAFSGPSAPWAQELQQKLRAAGYRIISVPHSDKLYRETKDGRLRSSAAAASPYVLVVEAGPKNTIAPCLGGGFQFQSISANFYDTENSEQIFSYTGSGNTEGCQPFSGTIFGDIVNLVNQSWQ